MGLNLGSIARGVLHSISNPGPRTAMIGAAFGIPPTTIASVGAFTRNLDDSSGQGPVIPDSGPIGGPTFPAQPTMGMLPSLGRMSQIVASAIVKLSSRLGGAGTSLVGYGRKVWATLSAWAEKNPGVNLVTMLVSLGLTAEEAAHFMAWGATHKRKRRSRGISARDMRVTRRTTRKLITAVHSMQQLCGAMPHRTYHRVAHRRR